MPESEQFINNKPIEPTTRPLAPAKDRLAELQAERQKASEAQRRIDAKEADEREAAKGPELDREIARLGAIRQAEDWEASEMPDIRAEIEAISSEAAALRLKHSDVLAIITEYLERERNHQKAIRDVQIRLTQVKSHVAKLKGEFPNVKNDWYRLVSGRDLKTVSINANDHLSKLVVEEISDRLIYTGPDAIDSVIRNVGQPHYALS